MPEQLDFDFWDRLVLQPDQPVIPANADERLVLTIDDLLPNPGSPTARARARQRIFHDARTHGAPLPRPLFGLAKTGPVKHRAPDSRFGVSRWAILAAALLLLIGAVGIWAGAGSWPNKSNQSDGGFISAPQDTTGDVVMRGVNPGRTNTGPETGLERAPEVGWVYKVENNLVTVPVVVDGVAYIGESADSPQDAGTILAIRTSDGLLLWSFPTEHGLSATFAYDNDTLFAVDDNGLIYAVETQSGTERWRSTLRGEQPYQFTYYSDLLLVDSKLIFTTGSVLPVAASHDAIFVANPSEDWIEGDKHVYAVSTQDGSVLWDVPGLSGSETGGVSALSLDDGSLLWDHPDSPAFLGPAYADGIVYFGVHDPASLVALDAASGTERWRTVVSDTGTWNGRTGFAVTDTEVVAGPSSGEVITVNRRTGERNSVMPIFAGKSPVYMSSGIVVTGNVAIASNAGLDNIGLMEAIDLADQTVLWEFSLEACQWVLPVVADGRILALDGSDGGSSLVMLEIPPDSS